MTVDYNEYANEKREFFKKHENKYKTYTSPTDEYGAYARTYVFNDDAVWNEKYSHEEVTRSVEITDLKTWVNVTVKLFKTEFWSTESSGKCMYTQE